MFNWLVAGTYCEEEYGMSLNTKEGYFICPECAECAEPLLFEDLPNHNWETCPICGFEFMEG